MDYSQTAQAILNAVGGSKNIQSVTNCATRLRFDLVDDQKVQEATLRQIDGVIDINKSGAQYQVIIGPDVGNVMAALNNLLGDTNNNKTSATAKNQHSLMDRFFDAISGIFTPIIPMLTAAGMLKALLVLLKFAGILTEKAPSYQFLSFVSDSGFYFLPIFVAVSTAMKLKTNVFLAGMVGAALIHPNFVALVTKGASISLFGLKIPNVTYQSSVIPSILAIWFMSYVEKFADRISPKVIKFLMKPLVTLIIVIPFTFFLFGPLGSFIGNILAGFFEFLNQHIPWLVSTLMGALFPLLVMTGMHWSFTPIIVQSYATYNYEAIMGPGSFVSNICQGAAALAVALKSKELKMKEIASSAGVTALLGVTEPALFGVTLKVKNVLYCVMAGGAVGGLYSGLNGVVRYTAGTPGLASFAVFIGKNPLNIVNAFISVGIGFVVTFALTWFFAKTDPKPEVKTVGGTSTAKEPSTTPANKTISLNKPQVINSPLAGEVVALNEVPDPTFAKGLMGPGVAIKPEAGLVNAPFSGKVTMLFETKHAIGLTSEQGIEILIHLGLDTVELKGEGFESLVKQGDQVVLGQPLIKFDQKLIESKHYNCITPIILTNFDKNKMKLTITAKNKVNKDDELLKVSVK